MSNSPSVTFNISRSPGLENPVWMEQKIHHRETNQSTIYLFQRDAAKSSLWKCIKDYFNGVRSAGKQVEKHLAGTLYYKDHTFTQMRITNPVEIKTSDSSEIESIVARFERHIGAGGNNTFASQPHASPGNLDHNVRVRIETTESLVTKQRWGRIIDSIAPGSKNINFSDREKIKKIANYCVDSSNDRSKPASENEIKIMLKRLEDFIAKIPDNDENSIEKIERLQAFLLADLKKLQ